MEHSDYQDLLAVHAVDALDAPEARELSAHLESCADCRRELAELRDASALLAHAAEPVAPSDEVKRRIMREIQTPTRSTAMQASAGVPLGQALSTAWPNVLRLAAGIAFVALLLGIVVLWRRDAASRREIAELARQLNLQQRELQIERDTLSRQSEALTLLNSPDAKKFALSGTQTAQNARAMFVFDQKSGRAVLMTDGLPMTSADKAYEVWFIPKGHAPMPGKVFTVDPAGHAMITDQMPPEAMKDAVIAITVEPKSGSPAPTGPIYLASPAS